MPTFKKGKKYVLPNRAGLISPANIPQQGIGFRVSDFSVFRPAEWKGRKGKEVVRIRTTALGPSHEFEVSGRGVGGLNKKFRLRVQNALVSLPKKFPDEKFCVLDWGAEKGALISDLAVKYPKINFTGFSLDSYAERVAATSMPNVSFMHTTKDGLERYATRFAGKKKFHLAVSNFGLWWIHNNTGNSLLKHLVNISGVIPKNGLVLFAPQVFVLPTQLKESKFLEAGFKLLSESTKQGGSWIFGVIRAK